MSESQATLPLPPRASTSWGLDPQDLQAVVVADGDPVGLGGGPLHVVDLPLGRVGQDRILDGPGHLLDVPDQRLVVVSWKKKQRH